MTSGTIQPRGGVNAWDPREDLSERATAPMPQAFEEKHYPIVYWAQLWGFSAKTVREWLRDEHGPGILRQTNTGRRAKRDYTTIMVSAGAAARIYANRTRPAH
jgi:hypothetical protein